MTLAELERFFAEAATSGSGPRAGVDRVFKSSPGLSASARLAIYNRAYYYRLLGALESVFVHTKRALGDAEFERIGLAYVARHPSEHPAVERVGRSFSDYLGGPGSTPRAVVDLAALEWARLCALVAPNPTALATTSSIAPSEFPRARLCFVPALVCLSVDPRAFSLLSADTAEIASTETTLGVAVFRREHSVSQQALNALEFEALRLAMAGASMSRVCACFDTGREPEDALDAFKIIATWFDRQWVERIEFPAAAETAADPK